MVTSPPENVQSIYLCKYATAHIYALGRGAIMSFLERLNYTIHDWHQQIVAQKAASLKAVVLYSNCLTDDRGMQKHC